METLLTQSRWLTKRADGTSQLVRRVAKQGRKRKEYLMVRTNITTSREAKKIIKQKAKALGFSFSAYLEIAGILYTPELLIP